jgi:hypothetical protein
MIDAIYIVLVLEYPREFPNKRSVSIRRFHIVPHYLCSGGAPWQPAAQLSPKEGRVQFGLTHIGPAPQL